MLFEGTEKKFELTVRPGGESFREWGDAFWDRVVRRADARVLSRIRSDDCVAYLLSESSLFVWDRKLLMITCGTTRLQRAVDEVLGRVDPEALTGFFYERKNELFPHMQHSSFLEDAAAFATRMPGRAFQFGHKDEHHLNLFSLDREGGASPHDGTVEVLMYGLDESVRDRFGKGAGGARWLRERSSLAESFAGGQVDDHEFDPRGYSLNALHDGRYTTLHVSPNTIGSYASFETSGVPLDELSRVVQRVVDVFRPRAFDLVVFDVHTADAPPMQDYGLRFHQACRLVSGYEIHFLSFHRPEPGIQPPDELPLIVGETAP